MAREHSKQQQHIIQTVDRLIYEKGFNVMSFKDIAEACGLSKGNLYYYFKTKDELLKAVIDYRLDNMQDMLHAWEQQYPTLLERLQRYVQIMINETSQVIYYGCPMGSLNTELAKGQPELQAISRAQFDLFRSWLKKQFKQLLADKAAEHYAMRLMARTQGVVVIAQAYQDKRFIKREAEEINQWLVDLLDSLAK